MSGYYRNIRDPLPLSGMGEKTARHEMWEEREDASFLPGFRRNPGCAPGEPGTQQLCRVAPVFAPNGVFLTKVHGSATSQPVTFSCFQPPFVCLTQRLSEVRVRLSRN